MDTKSMSFGGEPRRRAGLISHRYWVAGSLVLLMLLLVIGGAYAFKEARSSPSLSHEALKSQPQTVLKPVRDSSRQVDVKQLGVKSYPSGNSETTVKGGKMSLSSKNQTSVRATVGANGAPNLSVKVNGQAVELPKSGTVKKTIKSDSGQTDLKVSVDRDSNNSSSSLNLNVQSNSSSSDN